jgi:hypothetical protein
MVAIGVADRARNRVAQLNYFSAFVPRDGQSFFDLNVPMRERMRNLAEAGDGWRMPPYPVPADTPASDVEWLMSPRIATPINCFEMKIRLTEEPTMQRHYIYATRVAPGDIFGQFAACARSEAGWRYHEIDASHNPNITAPEALMGGAGEASNRGCGSSSRATGTVRSA